MRVHRVWEVVVDKASARGKSLIRMIDEIDLEEDESNFNSRKKKQRLCKQVKIVEKLCDFI